MNLLSLIPAPYRLLAAGAALSLAIGGGTAWHVSKVHAAAKAGDVAGYARGHAEYTELNASMTRAALRATELNIATGAAWQAKVTTAEDAYAKLQTQHARTIVAQRAVLADNGKLRNEIAAYAAGATGGGGGPEDSVAAARERAAALGGLLAEALRADAESATDAEANADAVRTVLNAWPTGEAGASSGPNSVGNFSTMSVRFGRSTR